MSRSSPIRRYNIYDESSSPDHTSPESAQSTGRRKQRPNITPRTFTRFFTPRSRNHRRPSARIGSSRKVLREITAAAANRQVPAHSDKPSVTSVSGADIENIQPQAKRRKVATSDSPSDLDSSPLRRTGHPASADVDEDQILARDGDGGCKGKYNDQDDGTQDELRPRSIDCCVSQDHPLNGLLRRELGVARSSAISNPMNWQSETTSFFTAPGDKHVCHNVVPSGPPTALPFCTTSCNRSSLVAIGDEEGGVRLLDTELDGKHSFSAPYLSFMEHKNAILDLAFSSDDKLLATGAGDQTAHIIDIFSQQVTHKLTGHSASVKQVRFQPESSSIVATSSRDGSIQLWDLRCKATRDGVMKIEIASEPESQSLQMSATHQRSTLFAARVNAIPEAHSNKTFGHNNASSTATPQRPEAATAEISSKKPFGADMVSVTALAFLGQGRDHLLLTGGQANATVKLWDLRATHITRSRRSRHAVALSSTRLPESHSARRHWGLTSINVSSNGSRFYTVCKDNTAYAYSTSHLILGHAPELSASSSSRRPQRFATVEKKGLGPLYGFKHPNFQVKTFYVKGAIRSATENNTELLAVGSSHGCAILFPTDERYLRPLQGDSMPIYNHGTALIRGHSHEVTDVTWTPNGDLVTIGDDLASRCWREGSEARALRLNGEGGGRRWESGWAEATSGWDDDD